MAKLKPILFNTAMVQKIMAGEKTETRRVVLPQPEGARFVLDCDEENRTFDLMCGNNGAGGIFRDWAETVKPKFWFNDVLYIRETWRVQSAHRFEADAVEVLAHELAHVAVGIEHDHDEVWQEAFDKIFEEYNRIGNQMFPNGEQCVMDDPDEK